MSGVFVTFLRHPCSQILLTPKCPLHTALLCQSYSVGLKSSEPLEKSGVNQFPIANIQPIIQNFELRGRCILCSWFGCSLFPLHILQWDHPAIWFLGRRKPRESPCGQCLLSMQIHLNLGLPHLPKNFPSLFHMLKLKTYIKNTLHVREAR